MAKKIPTIGKVWLILMIVMQSFAMVTCIISGFVDPIYFIGAALEILAVVSLVMLLVGKGLPFFITYCIGYGAGTIIVQLLNSKVADTELTAAFMIGVVIGLVINFGLTYLSVKNTLKKDS